MDIAVLEDIGMTKAEAKVFITAVELGASKAGPIVEKSGLQNAVVHRTLHSLIQKGLITYIFEGRIKVYQAVSVTELLTFVDRKKQRVQEILPELLIREKTQKPTAQIYEGTKSVKDLLRRLFDSNTKEYLLYGSAKESIDIMGAHFWKSINLIIEENKIDTKLIFHRSLEEWTKNNLQDSNQIHVKFTGKNFEEMASTMIFDTAVVILIYSSSPIGILLESEEIVKSYKQFFSVLWEISEDM
jgi:sugar-specific transcriptional regulator TrmB